MSAGRMRRIVILWFAIAAPMGLSSSAEATPVSEFNGLPEAVRAAAVSAALSIEAYRLSNRTLQNCVLSNSDEIKTGVAAKLRTVEADYVAEEVIAREIGRTCFGKKREFAASAARYMLASEFFHLFPNNRDKSYILRIGVGTQAALDLLNGEEERGNCIIDKFLVGSKSPAQ